MRNLDETDLEILRLLAADARRPYSDIGDAVGLSGPAVSDRVERLADSGVIERFTVAVDRSQLRGGVAVLVQVTPPADAVDALREAAAAEEAVEHVFVTADGEVWFHARVAATEVRPWVRGVVADAGLADEGAVDYDVRLVEAAEWTPSVEGVAFALTCAECGNTVDSEGESARVDGEVHHFCCPSCRSQFVERYERLEEGV